MKKWMELLLDDCKNNNLTEIEIKAIIHSLLRDFAISKYELKELYEIFEYDWDEEFLNYGRAKHIDNIKWRYFDFDTYDKDKGCMYYEEIRFDREYYSYLVKRAMTSKGYTTQLIDYVKGVDNISFTYYALDDIRIRKLLDIYPKYDYYLEIDGYITRRQHDVKIATIYDLWKDAYIQSYTPGGDDACEDVLETVYKILIEVFNMNIDKDNYSVSEMYIHKVEELLLLFDKKVAKSIKVNFLILYRYFLELSEYDIDKGKLRSMTSKLYKSLDQDLIDELRDYHIEHVDSLKSFCSGYIGLANAIFKEVILSE